MHVFYEGQRDCIRIVNILPHKARNWVEPDLLARQESSLTDQDLVPSVAGRANNQGGQESSLANTCRKVPNSRVFLSRLEILSRI
jgi:hypothetical protein